MPWRGRLGTLALVVGYLLAATAWAAVVYLAVDLALLLPGLVKEGMLQAWLRGDVGTDVLLIRAELYLHVADYTVGWMVAEYTARWLGWGALALVLLRAGRIRLGEGLALDRVPLRWAALVVVSLLAYGLGVGWLVGWLIEELPAVEPTVHVWSWFEGATPGEQALLALAVCGAGPVMEELLCRGALWRVLEGVLPTWAVWLGTSVLFALAHGDPLYAAWVLPVGLLLGWLRWWSDSTRPSIALHVLWNSTGVFLLVFLGAEEALDALEISHLVGALALVCLGLTLVAARSWSRA